MIYCTLMVAINLQSLQVTKMGTTVTLDKNPSKLWVFIPGAFFIISKTTKPSKIVFPGYHRPELVLELIKNAPTFETVIINDDDLIYTTTTYVKKRCVTPKTTHPGGCVVKEISLEITRSLEKK